MEKNTSDSKIVIITAGLAAIFTSFCLTFFPPGNFIEIPKGTLKGAIITAAGALFIAAIISTLALAVMLFLKRINSK